MSPFIKALLDKLIKPQADAAITRLKADLPALEAEAEAAVANGAEAIPAVVTAGLARIKQNPLLGYAEATFLPTLEADASAELGTLSTTEIPVLANAFVAFLEKIDDEL